ncbi:MAG: hypothetical protein P8019_06510 [Gammaproteobacteria bacterium]
MVKGSVVAQSGNSMTLRGATLIRNTGTVTAVQTTPTDVVMKLTAINGRNPVIYDFSGTQASPTDYDVDPGTLDGSSIAVNSGLKVHGLPVLFASGPVDFTAQTLIQ